MSEGTIRIGDRFRGQGKVGPGHRRGTIEYTVVDHCGYYTAFRAGGLRELVASFAVTREPPYSKGGRRLVGEDTLRRLERVT